LRKNSAHFVERKGSWADDSAASLKLTDQQEDGIVGCLKKRAEWRTYPTAMRPACTGAFRFSNEVNIPVNAMISPLDHE